MRGSLLHSCVPLAIGSKRFRCLRQQRCAVRQGCHDAAQEGEQQWLHALRHGNRVKSRHGEPHSLSACLQGPPTAGLGAVIACIPGWTGSLLP